MFQNMLLTGLTPLHFKTEANSWENRPFRTVWPEQAQQKPKDIKRTIKKKPKRVRTAFTTDQIRTLESTFCRYKYINTTKRYELAKSLKIEEKCIKIWFQNRRMKEKRESSESSYDSSSESPGSETPPVPNTPPPQVNNEPSKTEYAANIYYHAKDSEYSYQLPTYYEVPQNMYGQMPNVSEFCNDNNVYPTQYYPSNTNYSGMEGFNNNYGSEMMNQYWAANHNPYYAPI